eukprot:7298747-Alexandrium_andersonii.AAC.1
MDPPTSKGWLARDLGRPRGHGRLAGARAARSPTGHLLELPPSGRHGFLPGGMHSLGGRRAKRGDV